MSDNPPMAEKCWSISITDLRAEVNKVADWLVGHPDETFVVTRMGKPVAIVEAVPEQWQSGVLFAHAWPPALNQSEKL